MNNFSGIGIIAMDPKKGNGVLSSLLAIKRIYKSSDGIGTDFIPITLFQRQAENFDRLTKKGDKVGIDGSLKTSRYTDKNDEVRFGWSVTVNHFYALSQKGKAQGDKSKDSVKLSDATFHSLSTQLNGIKDSDLPF